MDIKNEIKEMIEEDLLDDPMELKFDTSLFQDKILDSMKLTLLISFIEESYEIKVKPLDIVYENFDTINNMETFIERKKA